ncbi:MAG: hypothetical protein JO057_13510 [Chloroflexi bacterium]|nr:hypothetical protein [Chloroflexota bacterium]
MLSRRRGDTQAGLASGLIECLPRRQLVNDPESAALQLASRVWWSHTPRRPVEFPLGDLVEVVAIKM